MQCPTACPPRCTPKADLASLGMPSAWHMRALPLPVAPVAVAVSEAGVAQALVVGVCAYRIIHKSARLIVAAGVATLQRRNRGAGCQGSSATQPEACKSCPRLTMEGSRDCATSA